MTSASSTGRSRQRSERASLPLPVIDLGLLLGPNFRYRRSSAPSHNDTEETNRESSRNEADTNIGIREQHGLVDASLDEASGEHAGDNSHQESATQPKRKTGNSNLPANPCGAAETQLSSHPPHRENFDSDSFQDEMTLEELKCLVNRKNKSDARPVAQSSNRLPDRGNITGEDIDSLQDEMTLAELKSFVSSPKGSASIVANEMALHSTTTAESAATGENTKRTPPEDLTLSVSSSSKLAAVDNSVVVTPQNGISREAAASKVAKKKTAKRTKRSNKRVPTAVSDIASNSLNHCVPLKKIPSGISSAVEEMDKPVVPNLSLLVNFPNQDIVETDDGNRKMVCAMCGNCRPVLYNRGDGSAPYIQSNAKAKGCVCSSCEAAAWELTETKMQVKCCTLCKRFHPLASFAPKRPVSSENSNGLLSLCIGCRTTATKYQRKRRQNTVDGIEETDANVSNGSADGAIETNEGDAPVVAEQCAGKPALQPTKRKRRQTEDNRVATVARDIASDTLNRCVPMAQVPFEFPSYTEEAEKIVIPEYSEMVNFPNQRAIKTDTGNRRVCAMCGNWRNVLKYRSDGMTPYILSSNKPICSSCEITVWKLVGGGVHTKFCALCRDFRPLAFFVPKASQKKKGFFTSCSRCRNRSTALHAKKGRTSSGGSGEANDTNVG